MCALRLGLRALFPTGRAEEDADCTPEEVLTSHPEEDADCTPQVVRQPPGEQNQMPPRALSQFPSQKQPEPNLRYLGLVKSKSFCHYWPSVGSQHKIHRMIPLCHLHLLTTLPVLLLWVTIPFDLLPQSLSCSHTIRLTGPQILTSILVSILVRIRI